MYKIKRERTKVLLSVIVCLTLAFSMFSAAAYADDNGQSAQMKAKTVSDDSGSNGEGGEGDQGTVDPGEDPPVDPGEDPVEEEKADSVVTVTRTDRILEHFGGTITGVKTLEDGTKETITVIKSGKTNGTVVIPYGEKVTFKISKNSGYAINKVVVDGENLGAVTKVDITGDEQEHSIDVYYSKNGLFIMLDAGHAGKYNRGCVSGYWESQMTWKLTNKLKAELEKYPGIVVGLTKRSLYDDPYIYDRGRMAKGYDLFISIHSNWAYSSRADYPLAIVSSKYKPGLYKIAQPLGKQLAFNVQNVMGTRQDAQVWVKRLSTNGQDWYGVLRGCASVNVPGAIIEHSFHSNKRACSWLMKDSNLDKMARSEAKIIAKYYGFSKDGSFRPGRTAVKLQRGKKKIKVKWNAVKGARGYVIYRSTKKKGTYKKVKVVKSPVTRSWTNKRLKAKKRYYYKVRAFSVVNGKNVYSAYSAVKSIKTK